MSELFDSDPERSASHSHMAAHLIAPLAAGSSDVALPLEASGLLRITETTREPLLLAAPSAPLDNETLRLRASLTPDGGEAVDLPPVEFGPYTEAGAFLPVHLPGIDGISRTAAPFSIRFSLEHLDAAGNLTLVDDADLANRIRVRLLEGVLGRMIYVLGAEKQRVRRQGRELNAMRILERARADALDRIGAALGVTRFADEIGFDSKKNEIVTETRLLNGVPVSEPDAEYRKRIAIYRPFALLNRTTVLNGLNGLGDGGDPNAGLLAALGVRDRFTLHEADNEFAVTIQIIGSGGPQFRDNFFAMLRSNYLVLPEANAANDALYAARFIPSTRRAREEALRASLRNGFTMAEGIALAPALAAALDRLGRVLLALGAPDLPRLLRAQDAGAGSRYELGLGADLLPLPAGTLDGLADTALDPGRRPSGSDEVEAIIRAAQPVHPIVDPDGAWLFDACGLQTHHRVDKDRIYVSHLPTSGLRITVTGPTTVEPGARVDLRADFDAPGQEGTNVVLGTGIAAALEEWTASGGEPLTLLEGEAGPATWDHTRLATANEAASLTDARLPVMRDLNLAGELHRLPDELVRTLVFGPVMTKAIQDHDADIGEKLSGLLGSLRRHGLVSALIFTTDGNDAILVTGVIGLPLSGLNLSERRGAGFRWYVVPIQGSGQVKSTGSRSVYFPSEKGLAAVVLIGFARRGPADPRGSTDPYEVGVDLPDGALLNVKQYEFLMNYLSAVCPMGVEINTFNIRQRHVDLDGDGAANPLLPSAARTFRQFRRARQRAEAANALTT